MTYSRWTPAEHAELIALADRELGPRAIAAKLGRSYMAVYCRSRVFSIRLPHERRPDLAASRQAFLLEQTWERLASRYGPDRADQIQAGRDPKTQADLASWRNLGRGRDAA